ncbi:MAG: hypothetical protein H0T42_20370 [Deltaproteobacteria bacterium]|nr:hypothetical protein [Deltaproteobacteria bacterium]
MKLTILLVCGLVACKTDKGDPPSLPGTQLGPRPTSSNSSGPTADSGKPALCRLDKPRFLHLRAIRAELSGDGWAKALIADATKQNVIAPAEPKSTIFDILGVSAAALKGNPDAIKAAFATSLRRPPTSACSSSTTRSG